MDTEPIQNQFKNNFPTKLSIFHELCKRFRQNPLAGGRATNILDSPRIKRGASLLNKIFTNSGDRAGPGRHVWNLSVIGVIT